MEILHPGCFTDSLRAGGWGGDVVARVEHDPRLLIGRRSAGTLRLTDSATVLRYEVDLPDTSCGRDTAELCARGDLVATSFSFIVEDPERDLSWEIEADGTLVRAGPPGAAHGDEPGCPRRPIRRRT